MVHAIYHAGFIHVPNVQHTQYVAIISHIGVSTYVPSDRDGKHLLIVRMNDAFLSYDVGASSREDVESLITEISCALRGVDIPSSAAAAHASQSATATEDAAAIARRAGAPQSPTPSPPMEPAEEAIARRVEAEDEETRARAVAMALAEAEEARAVAIARRACAPITSTSCLGDCDIPSARAGCTC